MRRGLSGRERVLEERKDFEIWFKDHIATYEKVETSNGIIIEVLTWKKPNTSVYFVRYVKIAGTLMVYGDIGDAVYQWHPSIGDIQCISGLEVDYFAGKCLASEKGRGYKDWNEYEAIASVKEYIQEEQNVIDDEYIDGDKINVLEKFDELDGWEALESEWEWYRWLSENGHDFFGDDYSEFGNVGEVIDIRCHSHLYGLHLAVKQLHEKGVFQCS